MDGQPTKKTKRSSHGNALSNPPHVLTCSRPYMFLISGPPSEDVNTSLEVFLSNNAPSKITKQQTPWIRVFKDNEEKDKDTYGPEAVGNIKDDWRSMPDKDKNLAKIGILQDWRSIPDKDKDPAKIHGLAKKYQMTTGKWMIFVSTERVDEVWGQIVKGLAGGFLGDHVSSAKESKKMCVC